MRLNCDLCIRACSSASLVSSSSPTRAGLALPLGLLHDLASQKPLDGLGLLLAFLQFLDGLGIGGDRGVNSRGDRVAVGDHLVAPSGDDRLGRFAGLDHPAQDFAALVGIQLACA